MFLQFPLVLDATPPLAGSGFLGGYGSTLKQIYSKVGPILFNGAYSQVFFGLQPIGRLGKEVGASTPSQQAKNHTLGLFKLLQFTCWLLHYIYAIQSTFHVYIVPCLKMSTTEN